MAPTSPPSTESTLQALHEAEKQVLQTLRHAAKSIRDLSDPEPMKAFMNGLSSIQETLRAQIAHVNADLPFENGNLRRLIEADLAIQRTNHIHRALVRTLAAMGENVGGAVSAAPSPGYMPSPVDSTPLVGMGVAPSPVPTFTVAVPGVGGVNGVDGDEMEM